jgi:hypothetical protein
MSVLVEKLSSGDHPVEISIRPKRTAKDLQNCIEKGYVHLKFTDTQGGTDLYVPLQPGASELGDANFDAGTGRIKIVGKLTLDYVPVLCVADIELETMAGTGHLQPVKSIG